MTGSECQYICQGVQGATYFTHWNEGPEADWGWCGCFSKCYYPERYDCRNRCSTHEVFDEGDITEEDVGELDSGENLGVEVGVEFEPQPRPGGVCHCMRGPLQPDVDSCDIWG